MFNDDIKKIIENAVFAPSGDNSQPWKFVINEQTVTLINVPSKDNSTFNYNQYGSYIAHGAVLENIIQLSPTYGLKANIKLFPSKDLLVVAEIVFEKNDIKINNNLISIIKKRVTNRKKFLNTKLEEQEKIQLTDSLEEFNNFSVKIVEDSLLIKEIANSVSVAEKVMLQYRPLHKSFFSMIKWNKAEAIKSQSGLFIDTLELFGPKKIMFKWFSNWTAAKILRLLCLPTLIAKENSQIYSCCAAMFCISNPTNNPNDFVNTGRILQRIWLKATELNLYIQPLIGVIYLNKSLNANQINNIDTNLSTLITDAANNLSQNFQVDKDNIKMIFRIGKSSEPSANSIKQLPEIKII